MAGTLDLIRAEEAGTLDGLFIERVQRSAGDVAYCWHDRDTRAWRELTWREAAAQVARWQAALSGESLAAGDRVAILLRNCPEWVLFDQAALGLGMVDVPLYTDDRPDNIAFILQDAGVRLLLVQDEGRWRHLQAALDDHSPLERVIILGRRSDRPVDDPRIRYADDWLPEAAGEPARRQGDPDGLASIVYTSGTTGRPKGVMLSHRNMLSVADGGLQYVPVYREDRFLSFLPLSHTLERTAGYYLPIMTGSSVTYARSVAQLGQDFLEVRPSVMISVPRVFERVYAKVKQKLAKDSAIARFLFHQAVDLGYRRFEVDQGRTKWTPGLMLQPLLDRLVGAKIRARLGGEMRAAISGGAPLSAEIARIFIGLGVPILQGYGLTETAPVISVNPPDDNEPASVGLPLRNLEVKIGEDDELLVRGPGVMLGYWNNETATRQMIDADGWLHTGDQVRIERGHIHITGRIKDILVLSNGEKVPPSDMEMAIALDPLVDQVMVVGEGHPYLTALVVLNAELWPDFARANGVDPETPDALRNDHLVHAFSSNVRMALKDFPGYAKIRKVTLVIEPWTIDNGLLTPTMKIKRARVLERHAQEIEAMYARGPAG